MMHIKHGKLGENIDVVAVDDMRELSAVGEAVWTERLRADDSFGIDDRRPRIALSKRCGDDAI